MNKFERWEWYRRENCGKLYLCLEVLGNCTSMAVFQSDGYLITTDVFHDRHVLQFTPTERPEWAETTEAEALRAKIKELEGVLDDYNESAMGEDL